MLFLEKKQRLSSIPLFKISPNPAQPRKRFSMAEIEALAKSIEENGLIQPIIVRKAGNGYELIAGERRLRAAKLAGFKEINAVISDCTDKDSATLAIVENLQRKSLSLFEEALSIYSLIKEWEITQEEAAKKLNMSQSAIANKVRLLRLGFDEQKLIEEYRLTERHARALLKIDDKALRLATLKHIITKELNVKNSEEYIHKLLNPKKKQNTKGFICGDVRVFMNTVNNAVSTMLTAGIYANLQKIETDNYIECIVKIEKPQH